MRRLIPSLFVLIPIAISSAADSAHEAVAAQKLRDSDLKGSGTAKTPYREVAPDGGLLVGLDVGLGGSPAERVTAIRPLYRVEGKNRAGSPAGHFLSDEVTRTVRLVAHDGYAVAGIRVSAGKRIDGLAVCFARADGSVLNPTDAYESAWVGSGKAESRELVDGQGRPAVGLFGRIDGDVLVGLGLTFADPPVPPAPAPAPATVGTLATQPDPPARAPAPSGNTLTVVALIVSALVAVSIGLIGIVAARRRQSGGVQKLPPAAKSVPDINLHMTRPPSIPTDLLLPGTRPPAPARKPTTDAMIALEMDAFRD